MASNHALGGGEGSVSIPTQPADAGTLPTPTVIHEVAAKAGVVARFAIAGGAGPRPELAQQRRAAQQLLRELLSLSFPGRAGDWQLRREPSGVPSLLAAPASAPRLQVSISHCRSWVGVGITTAAGVGVDVEVHRPGRDTARLAAFLGWETAAPCTEEFYRRWTLWEAYSKCRKGRLFEPAGPEFAALGARDGPAGAVCWHSFTLPSPAGVWAAAVLRTRTPRRLRLRELDPRDTPPW